MSQYEKTIHEKNGFKLVEIKDGTGVIVGYAILGPNGEKIAHFSSLEDALKEFEELTSTQPPPDGFSGP